MTDPAASHHGNVPAASETTATGHLSCRWSQQHLWRGAPAELRPPHRRPAHAPWPRRPPFLHRRRLLPCARTAFLSPPRRAGLGSSPTPPPGLVVAGQDQGAPPPVGVPDPAKGGLDPSSPSPPPGLVVAWLAPLPPPSLVVV
uniref:Uncharacterized protein n=1 Tax=Oryza glumipatula TaxID=40148 RepID=A0A0E0BMA3_9ORYZ